MTSCTSISTATSANRSAPTPRRRRRGHGEHHVGKRRLRVSRRRSGCDAGAPCGWRATQGSRSAPIPAFRTSSGSAAASFARRRARSRTSSLYQIGALAAIARAEGARWRTSRRTARSTTWRLAIGALADAIARAVAALRPGARPLRAARDRSCFAAGRAAGLAVAAEGFADRAYAARRLAGVARRIRAPSSTTSEEVVRRSLRHGARGRGHRHRRLGAGDVACDTLCIHGDTPGATSLTRDSCATASSGAASPSAASVASDCQHDVDVSTTAAAPTPACSAGGTPARADAQRALVAGGARLDARRLRRHALRAAAPGDHRRPRPDAADGRRASDRSTLVAAAGGGLVFGVIADRYGRTRALMASVHHLFGVHGRVRLRANTRRQLAIFRIAARHRHGRRVGERRGAGVGDLAGGTPRQGARPDAERAGRSATALPPP